MLDKELRQIVREAESGKRIADQLVKVWTMNGDETWVLIHVEVQAQRQSDFSHRMFGYFYRIHDLFQRPVASFAILADEHASWRPSEYSLGLWGSSMRFRFPAVKILDYAGQWDTLEKSKNPFAIVVQAHLKTLETQQDIRARSQWKITLAKTLYRRGFNKNDIIKLFRFIDWIMVLPEFLETQFYQDMIRFEEDTKMPFMSIAERIGMEKGLKQGREEGWEEGREEGREEGKLIGEILLAQRVLGLTIYDEKELKQKDLDELRRLAGQFESKLSLSREGGQPSQQE